MEFWIPVSNIRTKNDDLQRRDDWNMLSSDQDPNLECSYPETTTETGSLPAWPRHIRSWLKWLQWPYWPHGPVFTQNTGSTSWPCNPMIEYWLTPQITRILQPDIICTPFSGVSRIFVRRGAAWIDRGHFYSFLLSDFSFNYKFTIFPFKLLSFIIIYGKNGIYKTNIYR